MNTFLISVVRDSQMHARCVLQNPLCRSCTVIAIDNQIRNDSIGVCYNRFLDSRPADEDAWYVFCHEDFEFKEDPARATENLDRYTLWGPIGASTKVVLGLYHKWQFVGSVEECRKDGSDEHLVGVPVPLGTRVETFDCQCLIVHSSLVRKHHLRFDENLTFDLYVEDFCIAAHEKSGVESRIVPLSARHWSGGSVQPRYYEQEAYLNRKYPNVCYTGTSSWSIGGNPPFGRRMTIAIKTLVKEYHGHA